MLVSLIVGCTASCARSDARDLQVARATRQTWSGGVPGRAGTKYGITLVSAYPPTAVRIAGLWTGSTYLALSDGESDPRSPAGVSYRTSGNSTEYRITIDEITAAELRPDRETGTTGPPVKPWPPVKATAVLDVYVSGTERYVPITTFEALPPIHYP